MFIMNWLRSKNVRKTHFAHTNPKRKRGPYSLEALEPRAMLAAFQGLGGLAGVGSAAYAISDNGLVVVGSSNNQAFRWEAGVMVGLGVLPGGNVSYGSRAQAVSADGSVIVGESDSGQSFSTNPEAFRWTLATGMVGLGGLPSDFLISSAHGVSADGSVVVGSSNSTDPYGTEGFRWTEAGGMTGLGALPGEVNSFMDDISADGNVIVGGNSGGNIDQAVRWTEATGTVGLGRLPGDSTSKARAVSPDGSVIVGSSYLGAPPNAFRWTENEGMVALGVVPGTTNSFPRDVSADGAVIVGVSLSPDGIRVGSFIWDAAHGMRDLQALLVSSDYGLGSALAGWTLNDAFGVSADGRVIAGSGINPIGVQEAWIADLTPTDPGTPTVDAGPNQTIAVPGPATLDGTIIDNNGDSAPTVQWSVISGPGTVTFADDTAEDTTATFSTTGTYGLKLEATDGALTSADYVYVTVNPLSADLTAVADTYISNASKESTKNFGGATGLISDGNPDKSTLVRWDLSSVPAGSVVHSATISVNVSGTSGDTYEFYEVLQNWVESQATWTKATSTTNWSAAGVQGAAHGTTVLGTISAPTAGVRMVALGADGLAAVQRWINTPASNFGMILQDYANSTNDDLVISSRETGASANRPRLVLTYDPPIGSPSSVVVSVSEARTPAAEMRVEAARQHRSIASATVYRVSSGQGTTLDAASVDATMRLYATRRPRSTRDMIVSAP
jgi:probable HAF family extracellular repeat protein